MLLVRWRKIGQEREDLGGTELLVHHDLGIRRRPHHRFLLGFQEKFLGGLNPLNQFVELSISPSSSLCLLDDFQRKRHVDETMKR